jgi:hypothetical protein
MGRSGETLKKELLELDPEERAEVAEEALRSLADSAMASSARPGSRRSKVASRASTTDESG